jgi:glyoxylase-like metal-dependent hydrolase (beta-lactamase superfamily II)
MNIPEEIILKQMEIGPLQNFIYFVGDSQSKEIAVIDPAWDVDFLCREIKKNQYKVVSVFLTHAHPDHVNGLTEFLKNYDVPAYLSQHEFPIFKPRHKNIIEIDDKAQLKVGKLTFEVLWTPGHSPGCQCFRYKDVLITGDAIFIDGCGRCDLPGSNVKAMYNSLYHVINKLPDATLLFTGHNYGPATYATLASQKRTNPYLQCSSLEEFAQERLGIIL